MAQRVPIPIARRQGEAKSKFVSSQRLCNAFLEQDPETAEFALYGAPGLSLLSAIGVGEVRGVYRFGGVLLAVVGTTLYTMDAPSSTPTSRGSIAGTAGVIISDNGFEAVIVAEDFSYVWDGSTLSAITDTDFLGAGSVDFLDQYLIFTKPGTGQFFLSALADATSYDALDVATAESRPDNLLRVIVQNREALLMGTDTGEGWSNVGDSDFPLARDQTFVEVGLIGKYAIALIDNSVAWLASDKTVRIQRGGTPQIISDPLISAEIERWADASITKAFAFTLRGHQFLVLRNPDGCLVWDASLPANLAWHMRKSQNSDTWRVTCAETMAAGSPWNGAIVMGDDAGNLYTLDADTHSENGAAIIGSLTSRTMGPGGQPFTVDCIEAEIAPGVGLPTGQGSTPKVWLEASRDSGETFGARMERGLGAAGVRNVRVQWRDLGQFPPHGGVIRLSWSDPVSMALTKGWADIQVDAI